MRGVGQAGSRGARTVYALSPPAPSPMTPGGANPPAAAAVTAPVAGALNDALVAEQQALATYRNVMTALGSVAPFVNIARSESQHVAVLEALMAAHGVPAPTSAPTGAAAPATRAAACQLGVATETALIATYDRVLPIVGAYPDITRVVENLRDASVSNHLPAFLRCA